ncbi:MAG: YncE family protein [Betaproteobacteria bacterium]
MRIARLLLVFLILGFDAGNVSAAGIAKDVIATIGAGSGTRAVAVNPATNRIYVANEDSGDVTVIDGASNSVLATVPVGPRPQYIAVSAATNRVFVSNAGDSTLALVDGASLAVKRLAIGSTGPIAINERRNQVYVVRTGNADEVTLVDTAALTWYTAATDSYVPMDLAVDEGIDRLYVAHYASGDVRAVDLASTSDHPPTVSIGVWSRPTNIALDTASKRLFVIGEDPRGPISIIDTAANKAIVSFAPAGHAQVPRAVVVNPATNKAYAAFANEVVVIDGNANTLAFLPMPTPVALAVNPATNRIYAPNASGSVTVIDGATNAMSTIAIAGGARAVAVNAATNRIYVAGSGGVAVIDGAAPLSGPAPVLSAVNAQGLWWASPPGSESGWGLHLTHQGDVLFGTWFTYDGDGSPMWLVMSSGTKIGANSYSGTLLRTTGPAFGGTFDPSKVTRTPVGSATVTFTDADNGVLSATVDGTQLIKRITRQAFAAPRPTCEANGPQGALPVYQDLWWNAPAGSESGWGVNIAQQGDVLFATWFTYGSDGRGTWLVASNVAKTGNATFSGTLYRAIGPAFSASPWDPSKVSRAAVGQVTFVFRDANNATMSYTVDGLSQGKAITRQVFAAPPTVCR